MRKGKRSRGKLAVIAGSVLITAPAEAAGPLGPGAPTPVIPAPQAPKVTPPPMPVAPTAPNQGGAIFQRGGSSAGGARSDTIGSSGGADTIFSGAGDTITGGAANATIFGASGDTINLTGSGAAKTTVFGSSGDTITSGAGAARDTIFSGAGDTITGGAANATIFGASGDTINLTGSGVAKTTVFGGSGDTITAGSGPITMGDTIAGGKGLGDVLGKTAAPNAYNGTTSVNQGTLGANDTVFGFDASGADRSLNRTSNNGTVPVTGSGFDGTFNAPGGGTPKR
jgi:Ca2+-binding RTX toxin-like protein